MRDDSGGQPCHVNRAHFQTETLPDFCHKRQEDEVDLRFSAFSSCRLK